MERALFSLSLLALLSLLLAACGARRQVGMTRFESQSEMSAWSCQPLSWCDRTLLSILRRACLKQRPDGYRRSGSFRRPPRFLCRPPWYREEVTEIAGMTGRTITFRSLTAAPTHWPPTYLPKASDRGRHSGRLCPRVGPARDHCESSVVRLITIRKEETHGYQEEKGFSGGPEAGVASNGWVGESLDALRRSRVSGALWLSA